ncbi:MAG: hypothetical protein J6X25_04555 [Bacteroidales bacterium]|nr:hypothetical protein [Bacteroidales bacterium]
MRKAFVIFAMMLVAGLSWSCKKYNPEESRRVLILYSAGYNSLSSALRVDIDDFASGYVPNDKRKSDVLLVISRLRSDGDVKYTNGSSPVLIRITRKKGKETKMDTLKVWPSNSAMAEASFMREALEYVHDEFPAKGYGMIFSSHGSGWLPARYYSDPDSFDPPDESIWYIDKRGRKKYGMPPIPEDEYPAVKSLGQDLGSPYAELEIQDLARAFPMHMDYIILDACLMGCIEIAYELRNVCDILAFSPTEVLQDGFDYASMASRLLEQPKSDVEGVCSDYFNLYNERTGAARSATISLVNCKALDRLADICAQLFSKYRSELDAITPASVQRYWRFERRYFYDLQDILLNCGINAEEASALQQALDACILYKASTPMFISEFDITVYSGFSMFLPAACPKANYLKDFYRSNVSWNARTGLVP